MYRVVATTANDAKSIKVVGEIEGTDTANAVVLENSEQKLNIRTMTITLTLPTDFVSENSTVNISTKAMSIALKQVQTVKSPSPTPMGSASLRLLRIPRPLPR